MIEKEIGYRGSKSLFLIGTPINKNSVKEQRVDGSWYIERSLPMYLRCTLMDFERNYRIKVLSNQIYRPISHRLTRLYSSEATQSCKEQNLILNPNFITGFTDGEGSFIIKISKSNKTNNGWSVQLFFQIALHSKDLDLLEAIKNFFRVGNINTNHGPQSSNFYISSIKDLAVIISHFDKFPLLTQKGADYELFKETFYLIKNKEHLTKEGLNKIVALKASGGAGCIPLRGKLI